ncbi:MAG: DUF167 domain-containing protein [Patescibacteria group bacterium]|nr:DUF167 domain-containing protein [Patescibacteria group bacterium]
MLTEIKNTLSSKGEVNIQIKATPGAKENLIKGFMADGTLKVLVTAAPEKNKANQAIVDLLAKKLAVPKSCISLLYGASSRDKVFKIIRK